MQNQDRPQISDNRISDEVLAIAIIRSDCIDLMENVASTRADAM
jgi:hypothetical protein